MLQKLSRLMRKSEFCPLLYISCSNTSMGYGLLTTVSVLRWLKCMSRLWKRSNMWKLNCLTFEAL
jgi:hypothetical protein